VPKVLKELVISSGINPGVLSNVNLSDSEKATGDIKNYNTVMETFMNYEEDANTETTMVSFLDKQLISDKVSSA
jgi:hypothetical protein